MTTCPECKADPEVSCPRDTDMICKHCGRELCGMHGVLCLKNHCVSLNWRGALKERRCKNCDDLVPYDKKSLFCQRSCYIEYYNIEEAWSI